MSRIGKQPIPVPSGTKVKIEESVFVEVLTMCPTGWFVPTADGPEYLDAVLSPVHVTGELKTP